MQLRFGKNSWLDLEPVSLTTESSNEGPKFALAANSTILNDQTTPPPMRLAASRAASVTNRVVQQTFRKSVAAFATRALRARVEPDNVEPAVFYDRSGKLRVIYREVVIRFEAGTPNEKRKAVLDKFGLEVRERNAYRKDQLIAIDPSRKYIAERMIELANALTETEEVAFAFPNFVSEFSRRQQAPQPIANQWHLARVQARKAWETTQGKNIVIAVLDDGVDLDHPNLKPNIKRNPDPSEPRDKFGRDFFVDEDTPDHFDPRPKLFNAPFDELQGNDIHGTSCAGVAAAAGVGNVFGVAPQAKILPVKVFHADPLATELRVANAIRYSSRFADILSCSWSGAPSPDIQFAIEEAANGRGGKGCPVFCATGNETAPVGFPASSPASIAVGASTDGQQLAFYSNRGPEVSIVAPSNGGAKGIFTTDVSAANRGFNLGTAAAGGVDGLNTNSFGGTSSATPLAAGIAALVLSANPSLSAVAVRKILQDTAIKIGPAGSYDANGHSTDFGFGEVNADKAVASAMALPGAVKASVVAKKKAKAKVKKAKAKAKAKKKAARPKK